MPPKNLHGNKNIIRGMFFSSIFIFLFILYIVRIRPDSVEKSHYDYEVRLKSGQLGRKNLPYPPNYEFDKEQAGRALGGALDAFTEQNQLRVAALYQSLDRTFDVRYNGLMKLLNLSDDEYNKIRSLIIMRQVRVQAAFFDILDSQVSVGAFGASTTGVFIPESAYPSDWKKRLSVAKSDPDAKVKAVLGEERYNDYIFYIESRGLQGSIVEPLQTTLVSSSVDPLNDVQQRVLLEDLVNANSDHMDLWHDFFTPEVLTHATQYMTKEQLTHFTNLARTHSVRAVEIQAALDRATKP